MRFSTRVMNRSGISLAELVIVALVMGIMAAVAAPRFAAALQYHQVEMAAKRIVADLEATRSLAYTTGVTQRFAVETSQNRYRLVGIVDPDRPTEADTVVELSSAPYHCTISSATATEVAFNGHGLPNRTLQIVIASSGLQRTVTVNATSGRASY